MEKKNELREFLETVEPAQTGPEGGRTQEMSRAEILAYLEKMKKGEVGGPKE